MTKRKTHTYRGISFTVPKEYEGLRLTLRHVKNMIDMAAAIQNSPPPKFDMGDFCSFSDRSLIRDKGVHISMYNIPDPYQLKQVGDLGEVVTHSCGTAACAIGTAAYHGVGRLTRAMDWGDYSIENFGLVANSEFWEYIFGANWASYDNSACGAVARILHLIIRGPSGVREDVLRIANPINIVDYNVTTYISDIYYNSGKNSVTNIYDSYKDIVISEK